ncbi:hypothetical protein ACU4GD_24710 [Cupriavidus basilensis]
MHRIGNGAHSLRAYLDVSLFPHAGEARLLNKHWRAPRPELLTYAHNGGYMPLRRVLAEHLRLVRSVRCEPEQII